MIGVAIIDDHPAIMEWFSGAVSKAPGLLLCFGEPSIEAFDCTVESLRRAAEPVPDVVLLDLSLARGTRNCGRCDGTAGVAHLVRGGFSVLVFSANENREAVLGAIEAGAQGYVTKTAPTSEILVALQEIAMGNHYVSPVLASYVLRASRSQIGPSLTSREKQILSLIATGLTDQEIAAQLGIRICTVRSHLDNIGGKLGNRRRAALASQAHLLGLTRPNSAVSC
jgi:DNA-binding NarL/FixJ family response regulator